MTFKMISRTIVGEQCNWNNDDNHNLELDNALTERSLELLLVSLMPIFSIPQRSQSSVDKWPIDQP